jgi:hypothetical protein
VSSIFALIAATVVPTAAAVALVFVGRALAPKGPASAERRLRRFRDGGWVMIPLTLKRAKVTTTTHGAVSAEVTWRRGFGVRVDGRAPHRLKLGWWDEAELGDFKASFAE